MMQAGELTHRIIIQKNTNNGTTKPLPTDCVTAVTVWAKKKGASGRLYYQAAASQSQNEVVFTVRYRTGITPTMRIIDNGDTEHPYEITADPVDPEDNRKWLEIHAQRIGANGS